MLHQKVFAVLKMSRAYFSLITIIPYLLGVGMAERADFHLNADLLLAGLVIQVLVQLSVSYINDYWDVETDRLNQNRTLLSGGSGELTTGILHPAMAMIIGLALQVTGVSLALMIAVPAVSAVLLVIAIAATHFYTAPPLKLVYRGWGELSSAMTTVVLVPLWGYSLQTGSVSRDVLLITLPLIPFMMGVMLAIATPDVEADRQVQKYTLAVRVGQNRIAGLYMGLIGLGYGLVLAILPIYLPLWSIALIFLNLPLTVWAWLGLRQPVKQTPFEWLWMILRPALAAGVPVIVLTAGVWLL